MPKLVLRYYGDARLFKGPKPIEMIELTTENPIVVAFPSPAPDYTDSIGVYEVVMTPEEEKKELDKELGRVGL